jgi:hypothetical protein
MTFSETLSPKAAFPVSAGPGFSHRIIPCLDVADGRTVKGVKFTNLRDVGDPVELAIRYQQQGADELMFLDISASVEGRKTMLDVVRRVARELSIPFSVGGGISQIEDVLRLLEAGADKVSLWIPMLRFGHRREASSYKKRSSASSDKRGSSPHRTRKRPTPSSTKNRPFNRMGGLNSWGPTGLRPGSFCLGAAGGHAGGRGNPAHLLGSGRNTLGL